MVLLLNHVEENAFMYLYSIRNDVISLFDIDSSVCFFFSGRELLTSRVFDQRQLMIQCMTFNPTGDLLGW